jgi:N-methylhydantoinase A
MSYVVGIDVGGTFTDLFAWDQKRNTIRTAKALSTASDQSVGILNVLKEAEIPLSEIALIVHGTTVATNAVLERKGARIALITTKGFRDVIELKRRDRPNLYGLKCTFEPLIPRCRRYEVDERTASSGEVLKEPKEEEVKKIAEDLLADNVECVVVGFFNSYANPSNEHTAADLLRSYYPHGYIIISSDVVNEFREFERISTGVTNAYVLPKVDNYLASLSRKLKEANFEGDITVVHSGGGIMSLEVARQYPVRTLLSGPSAGVAVGSFLANQTNRRNLITCDMGGTSFDVGLIKDGSFDLIDYKELTYAVPLLVQQVDMVTIGAGGGSIAYVDRSEILHVGPESAGAEPGPACYGRGGKDPTVTDANLILGRVDKNSPIGRAGELTLDADAAREAIHENIAKRLRLSVEEAALAIIKVVNANMAASIRLLSVARGHDPREFSLMAFGGAGPLHANSLMSELNTAECIIPSYPGATCGLGGLVIPFQYQFGETINKEIEELDLSELERTLVNLGEKARDLVSRKMEFVDNISVEYQAKAHYTRQTHFIQLTLPSPRLSRKELIDIFENAHRTQRGELVKNVPIHIMYVSATATGTRRQLDLKRIASEMKGSLKEAEKGAAKTYYDGGWIDCPMYKRAMLPIGTQLRGPAIVTELTSTTFIEPGWKANVDEFGNIVIREERNG